jgi:hypothetical protein
MVEIPLGFATILKNNLNGKLEPIYEKEAHEKNLNSRGPHGHDCSLHI